MNSELKFFRELAKESDVIPVGGGIYMICLDSKSQKDYNDHLTLLFQSEFVLVTQNNIADCVFTSILTKGRLVVSATYLKRLNQICLSTGYDIPLSKHLHPCNVATSTLPKRTATNLAMLRMQKIGNSFVFLLKNGHFIINDGGFPCELESLLTYLEQNVDKDEKPVVDAWVVSHAHPDHSGVLAMIAEHPEQAKRLHVEGIYFNEPSETKCSLDPFGSNMQISGIRKASQLFGAEIYRLQTGQRYYFSDITLDILLSSEHVPMEIHSNNFNDTSTWCLYNIEGQRCLLAGDADSGSCEMFTKIYPKDYWHFHIFTTFHHGSNTSDIVTEHCDFDTILVTLSEEPQNHVEENARLKAKAKEWFIQEPRTRLFTFPYRIGESKEL